MKSVMILGGPGNISESTVRYFINKGIPVATLTHATTNLLGMEDQLQYIEGTGMKSRTSCMLVTILIRKS